MRAGIAGFWRMRAALMAVLAALMGLAVAAIPLLPMLFCGAE